jgi:iron complex transport system permease protein
MTKSGGTETMARKGWTQFLILLAILVVVALLSMGVGPSWVSPLRIYKVRLPRVMLGIFAGSSLALIGASLQGILQNPLADPYILGVSSGAAFGAALAMVLRIGSSLFTPIFGFMGAILAIIAVYNLARSQGRMPKDTLLLSGVLVGFFFSALVMLLMVMNQGELHQITYLLMGNLGFIFGARDIPLFVVFVVIVAVCGVIIYSRSREMNLLSLGEEGAKQLGVETEKLKMMVFVTSSLVVGSVVAFCGSIGFIGLVVPHITRLIVGPDHRRLIVGSLFLGATLLLIADAIARTVAPVELPVGVITSLFGVPFFGYLLKRRKSRFD